MITKEKFLTEIEQAYQQMVSHYRELMRDWALFYRQTRNALYLVKAISSRNKAAAAQSDGLAQIAEYAARWDAEVAPTREPQASGQKPEAVSQWQTNEAPKDRFIVAIGNIVWGSSDSEAGGSLPFCAMIRWDAGSKEWFTEGELSIRQQTDERVVIHHWAEVPERAA